MLSALFSFLGGTAFRLIFGGVMDYMNRRQEHRMEVERMRMQADLDRERAAQDMARVRLQAELGVKQIEVQGAYEIKGKEWDAFTEAVKLTGKQTGVAWVDAWNAAIRPALATLAILAIGTDQIAHGWVLTGFTQEIVAGVIGVFIGDRIHGKLRNG